MLRSRSLLLVLGVVALAGIAGWQLLPAGKQSISSLVPARDLGAFAHAKPSVPVVFTSRSNPASFEAAAPEAEGFVFPGTIPWAASEGRLRLLDVTGEVYELTWGRALPNGGTLVDVMSPSVSLDGARVLFAGRQAPPDPGRWRIYEVELKSGALRQLTGVPSDPGCSFVPPMRYSVDGTMLTREERCRLDYDDVDPADLGGNSFVFASSRIPDLGRDHSRRATQIWVWPDGAAAPRALTANRNNDRWPVLTLPGKVVFSSWSRNREAVTKDLRDIEPVAPGKAYATAPTDNWLSLELAPNGAHLGYAVKSQEPVWRPRPLFNGRLAFMTRSPSEPGRYRLAQADWGFIQSAPSSLATGMHWPKAGTAELLLSPGIDRENRPLSAGCPSPVPGNRIAFAGSLLSSGPGGHGIYSIPDDWSAEGALPDLLFDDPQFEDSEPVAVYARTINPSQLQAPEAGKVMPPAIQLADGKTYAGPAGYIENMAVKQAIREPIPWSEGSRVHALNNPLVSPPTNIKSIVVYAAYRDRFDDLEKPRIPGDWKRLVEMPIEGDDGMLVNWVPHDPMMTTVLAGFDENGKVAKWTSNSKTMGDRTFFAYAGDHYSQVRANGYHYCNGCHAGHTFSGADIREKAK